VLLADSAFAKNVCNDSTYKDYAKETHRQ